MRIGELAQRGGCDVETVRFYEREGLIDSPLRESNGYRNYANTHLAQLNFIRHCRSLGMGLAEVRTLRHFQADPNLACDDINQLIDAQIVRIHEQLESLRQLEQQLHALRDTCHRRQTVSECGILRTLEQAADGEGCACHGESKSK
ncbi:Cd(II)/Pb(II)-responsive transcriptional regulator [uncultured Propionivibrio sp.]|uniref:Cd(II)/Pb(II)-responsive transcriptional regulator n=1 Tax=uncultured Propionivibrio sp. TaxID=426737 RepID=UPI0029C0A65A|nr:Cd(II)/Pb(II)-responsive transcriptional regulator [uncultured Propionivibrio sp.]